MIKNLTFSFLLLCLSFGLIAQENIAEARTYAAGSSASPGAVVTVTGIVTNSSENGPIRYIQDNTAGIAIYPANWDALTGGSGAPEPGDEITVTGQLVDYQYLLEVVAITEYILHSTGNPLPEYTDLTPNQFGETYEGMRVRVSSVIFDAGGNNFVGNSSYPFVSLTGQNGVVYIKNDNTNIVGEMIPVGAVNIEGILSQHSYTNPNGGYQLLPLDMDAFHSASSVNLNSGVSQTDLSTSSITLNWTTDESSTTGLYYGLTNDLGQQSLIDEEVIDHQITINGLEPGTPYYCQVFSVFENDTAFANIGVYSTVSESPGTITVYFNREVNHSYSTGVDAVSLFGATADTIIAQIDRAQTTLDVAAYNINHIPMVNAINAAYSRGVQVRYIAEDNTANIALAHLNTNIPRLKRMNAASSGMHNKFIIVDANNVDSALVLTGSTNFTSNNLFTEANNMVIINDQALARAYTLEFNEMWGSDGPNHNASASRFGEEKTKNTPEKFLIGGVPVELYFSPSDGTTAAIKNAIEQTDHNFDFALLTITNDDLAMAIAYQVGPGVTPRGIVQTPSGSGNDYDLLLSYGVDMITLAGTSRQLHHKYGIVDHSNPESDPTVITGSHNWSGAAETTNDENTLIIHDATVANQFYQEFMALYNYVVNVEEIELSHVSLYPNPASETFTMVFDSPTVLSGAVHITDLQGKMIYQKDFHSFQGQNKMEVYIGGLHQGVYLVTLSGEWGKSTQKLVKL